MITVAVIGITVFVALLGDAAAQQPLPTEFDWREHAKVPAIRDQGPCPSSWAFAVLTAMEVQLGRVEGLLSEFSKPDLACMRNESICASTNVTVPEILTYIKEHGVGLESENACDPYEIDEEFECRKAPLAARLTKIKSLLPFDMEETQRALIKDGPIIVGYDDSDALTDYHYGVHDVGCENQEIISEQAFLIIGYGEEDGVPYWLIQPSWGTTWGEKGYLRVRAGVNQCGIESKYMYQVEVQRV